MSATNYCTVFCFQVAAFYYMGIAGHFALGNSNSLATIDVAGAFIVCSFISWHIMSKQ